MPGMLEKLLDQLAGFPVRSGTFNEIPLITFTRAN